MKHVYAQSLNRHELQRDLEHHSHRTTRRRLYVDARRDIAEGLESVAMRLEADRPAKYALDAAEWVAERAMQDVVEATGWRLCIPDVGHALTDLHAALEAQDAPVPRMTPVTPTRPQGRPTAEEADMSTTTKRAPKGMRTYTRANGTTVYGTPAQVRAWSKAKVTRAKAAKKARAPQWVVSSVGYSLTPEGALVLEMRPVRDLAQATARLAVLLARADRPWTARECAWVTLGLAL